ncbi:hypothetical protein JTB14_004951 [Gonioctena quinquepunctata]|nr:hypothetical protein JTB14_004951 [Gonioctena quinquepunctata]
MKLFSRIVQVIFILALITIVLGQRGGIGNMGTPGNGRGAGPVRPASAMGRTVGGPVGRAASMLNGMTQG